MTREYLGAADGSSPLTRGKPVPGALLVEACRLIPAHAGKTADPHNPAGKSWAHPRSRGENARIPPGYRPSHGSSPLTRGKHHRQHQLIFIPRLIPAHAGKTDNGNGVLVKYRAHPRSRGENPAARKARPSTPGSSPLTRGKHFLTCAFTAQIGQILESLELCASSESYSSPDAYATDALQGRVRSIGLAPRSSRGAS